MYIHTITIKRCTTQDIADQLISWSNFCRYFYCYLYCQRSWANLIQGIETHNASTYDASSSTDQSRDKFKADFQKLTVSNTAKSKFNTLGSHVNSLTMEAKLAKRVPTLVDPHQGDELLWEGAATWKYHGLMRKHVHACSLPNTSRAMNCEHLCLKRRRQQFMVQKMLGRPHA